VKEGAESIDLFSLGGTLASFSSKGVTLSTRIVRRPRLISAGDGHVLSGRQVYFFSRLGSVGRRPVLLERFFFDSEIFPDFDALSWSGGSLSEAVRGRYHLEPLSADQSFEAVLPDCQEAKLLCVEETQPLLKVQRVLHFATARAAVASEILCRSDRFVMSQTIGGAFG
jgi:GntR family transcriptional regulator